MDNKKTVTIIRPAQPVTIKPASEVIIVEPKTAVVIKPSPALVIQPVPGEVITVQPARSAMVAPPPRGAWDERGWQRNTSGNREIYEGYYVAGTRKFRGRVEMRGSGGRNISAYIYNPPPEIKRHRHGACFQLVGDDWFYLHWSRSARTVDDAILYMERILDESLKG